MGDRPFFHVQNFTRDILYIIGDFSRGKDCRERVVFLENIFFEKNKKRLKKLKKTLDFLFCKWYYI